MKRPHLPWLAPGLLVLSNVLPIGRMMAQDTPSLEPRAAVASEGRPEATDSKAAEAQPEDRLLLVLQDNKESVKPQAEGLLHEAFLSPTQDDGPVNITKAPPPPIIERPGVNRPSPGAPWIEGYWQWDPAQQDFVWVSGTWRVPPPGRFWVNGYWKRNDLGWYRVPGYWSDRQAERIAWRKTGPPEEHPPDETGPAPGPDYFYVPGHYVPRGNGVTWMKGFWAKAQPGWAWVPAQWIRRPQGWVYQEGYWDRVPQPGTRPRGEALRNVLGSLDATRAQYAGGQQNHLGSLVAPNRAERALPQQPGPGNATPNRAGRAQPRQPGPGNVAPNRAGRTQPPQPGLGTVAPNRAGRTQPPQPGQGTGRSAPARLRLGAANPGGLAPDYLSGLDSGITTPPQLGGLGSRFAPPVQAGAVTPGRMGGLGGGTGDLGGSSLSGGTGGFGGSGFGGGYGGFGAGGHMGGGHP
ncbi:MAG: YXWGXW repeat-containing protein [Planctomycetaceae bacterium]|nr:YXWGXW repeat-containing protein [Planctomycetaceae bacterium]